MKSKLLILTFLIVAQQGFSQIGTGTLFVGGGFGISSSETTNRSTISLQPAVHYFISDNISFGGIFGFSSSRNNPGADIYTRNTNFSITPAVRYYAELGEKVFLYGEGSLGIGFGSSTGINGNNRADISSNGTFSLGLSPGIFYAPTEKIGFDLKFSLISYNRFSFTDETNDPTTTNVANDISFAFSSFTPTFGVYYIIGN
ncbi:outer membrane beta-barrel protein [Marivirga sp.]|uniref:outer membrane beta-barrel protein n=1 Tax=Marivirga sp. TaxID=2018662 RepID=UPI002D808E31|nr:outer membrane beta-barrel protein [Marivirga sp.]HET8860150.1 outer membrane beta-barrel protein [Marivirga sp.]